MIEQGKGKRDALGYQFPLSSFKEHIDMNNLMFRFLTEGTLTEQQAAEAAYDLQKLANLLYQAIL